MSKLSVYVPVRLPKEVAQAMDDEIKRREADPLRPPWTRSSFIIEAVQEKIRHRNAGRTSSQKRSKGKGKARKTEGTAEQPRQAST